MSTDPNRDHDFVDRVEAIVRLGAMMLAAGTGSYRVKRAMDRAAEALGMDHHDAVVGLTSIIMTVHRGDEFRTLCRQVHRVGVDASRIEALETLSRSLEPGLAPEELEARLDHVSRTVGARWTLPQAGLAAGLACAGFAVLNRYSLPDAAVVLVAATLGHMARRALLHRRLNHFVVAALAAAVAAAVYLLLVAGLELTPAAPYVTDAGYVASMLFLIPGFPMITSLLDMARTDFGAGMERALYAFAIVLSATFSAWVLSYLLGLSPLAEPVDYPGIWFWVAAALATFAGVTGFAVLFNSSRRMALSAGTLAVGGNLVRLALVQHHVPHQLAAGVGGLLVGLAAAWAAPRLRVPRITLTIPACVIMVPGAAMYRTVYWLNAGDVSQALPAGADAVLTVVMLTCGLVVARVLTDPRWAHVNPVASPHAFRSAPGEPAPPVRRATRA